MQLRPGAVNISNVITIPRREVEQTVGILVGSAKIKMFYPKHFVSRLSPTSTVMIPNRSETNLQQYRTS